jgi:hypothetical protein
MLEKFDENVRLLILEMFPEDSEPYWGKNEIWHKKGEEICSTFIGLLGYLHEFWKADKRKFYDRANDRSRKEKFMADELFENMTFAKNYSLAFSPSKGSDWLFDDDINMYILLEFLKPNYQPPEDIGHIVAQLYTLSRVYYLFENKFDRIPARFESWLAFISLSLMSRAYCLKLGILQRANEYGQIEHINAPREKKAGRNKQVIIV